MLERLVVWSVTHRGSAVGGLVMLLLVGFVAARTLPIDAMPDVSNVQVTVVVDAPGLSPTDVERMVTAPLELALNGLPQLQELRSVSRPGLASATAVFKDGMDVWFARQLVGERLREAAGEFPSFLPPPQLAPVSTGLGEIYIFVLRSLTDDHSQLQLRSLMDWEVIPRLRSVPGVIEVNAMGGELKQYQIRTSPLRLQSVGLSLQELTEAVDSASSSVGGGYLERNGETVLIRGDGRLRNEEDIGNIIARGADDHRILVKQVANVGVGAALRYGVNTRDGAGEVVSASVLMLLGSNSREVTMAVKAKIAEIQKILPPGVVIDPVYDRSMFIGRTLKTVMTNLIEGALVVLVVLALFLGTIRGALATVLGIPAAMSFALVAMHIFNVTGDLMSLGAIDFGFLVDGPIVALEAVLAGVVGKKYAHRGDRLAAVGARMASVAKPVASSVAIIMLVYLPLLSLQGVEGKMFRPMAIVMASALFGALVFSVLFYPGLLATVLGEPKSEGPKWLERFRERYLGALPAFISLRIPLVAGMSLAVVVSLWALGARGADFVPRIDEGDMVLTIRRVPSIGLAEALKLDLQVQKVLAKFPEVVTTMGSTGRAELALNPVGIDSSDVLIRLKPRKEWVTGTNLDELSVAIKTAVEREVSGTFVSVSQPIEDKTNELISGSRADVAIQLFGPDLDTLTEKSREIGATVRSIPGTGDIRIERLLGLPGITFTPDRERLARYGVALEDAMRTLEAARVGTKVGTIYEGARRYDVRLFAPPPTLSKEGLSELTVGTSQGSQVRLAELGTLTEADGPATVRRANFQRTVRVEVNLRGRDLASWVAEAKKTVAEKVLLPTGYTISWGGQFTNLARAQARLALVVPLAMAIIFGMLALTFGSLRVASAVFTLVPLALIGGAVGLLARGMNFSLPAAVGFIALAGVAVLNGVVMTTEVLRLLEDGEDIEHAILHGAAHSSRAVLTTAAVAALGFFPMMVNTGAGSEVQQPLATVVVCGIVAATAMMLVVFPGILRMILTAEENALEEEEGPRSSRSSALHKA